MLKLKDNVDLKELKKFGFDEEYSHTYYYYGECKWAVYTIGVEKGTRKIDLYVCTGDEDCSIPISECMGILFDLIQAGFVEKIKE